MTAYGSTAPSASHGLNSTRRVEEPEFLKYLDENEISYNYFQGY